MKRKVLLFSILFAVAFSSASFAMNPFRKAFVFFAVVRDGDIIAVQSNTLAIADDSESDSYILTLAGVSTEPGLGGSPVPGFTWERGSSYGGLPSEGRLRAENVPIGYWESNSILYCRFELWDSSAVLINSWDTPLFLRTIEHISFFFIRNGEGIPQTIPGDLPSSPPNYDYTGFSWSTVNSGGLAGATVSLDHADNGRTAGLQISGNPVSGWAQNDAPFDLYITSASENPDDVCVAEFRGLSWDGLETPYPAAQPTVSLRRLEAGGTDLAGYYWIRGQFDVASAINATLPSGATAKGILQDAPLSGSEFTLDENCGLTGLNFSPTYPSSNNFAVRIESDTNHFLGADSKELPIRFRDFDVDYSNLVDWRFPYAESPASVTEADRTLAIIGGDLFDWSGLSLDFDSGSSFSVEGSAYGKQGILLTWPYGGLVDGDTGSMNITLQSYEPGYPGWPASTVSLSVSITSNFSLPDTDGDGLLDDIDIDDDNDGVSDEEEAAGPNNGDSNEDGTQDSLQSNVSNLNVGNAQDYIVLEAPNSTKISNCQVSNTPADSPANAVFDCGLFEFTLTGLTTGGSATVTLSLPEDAPDFNTYYRFGPTTGNTTHHWYEFKYDATTETGAIIDNTTNTIALYFKDGARGDDDLTANETIVDIGGPARSATTDDSDSGGGGGGGGGGCFISTLNL